jgi:2-polyprenyl-3-methyl-5-hydroxy-6-metoxy-1,4-benzoquinol methylase
MNERTRANPFDRRVGMLQTELAMRKGVGRSICDVGCGIGEYTYRFLERFPRVVGVDPDANFLKEARIAEPRIEFVEGWGETFKLNRKVETITMNDVLEHVDDPIAVLVNCRKNLFKGGRIITQVPNNESIARQLGVIMGVIPQLDHSSEKEINWFGHKRTYNLDTLTADHEKAGLKVIERGGLFWKPLPNEDLERVVNSKPRELQDAFMRAMVEFGRDRPRECAIIYTICE